MNQQSGQPETLPHEEQVRWLAEQETKCPNVPEHVNVTWSGGCSYSVHSSHCPDCRGTGRITLFPMLRQECTYHWAEKCIYCEGRRWVLNKGLGALLKAARHAGYKFVSFAFLPDFVTAVVGDYPPKRFFAGDGPTEEAALSLALVRATVAAQKEPV